MRISDWSSDVCSSDLTHPTRGPIPPDEFIVQAEKSQDIYRLTLFVMDQAIRSAAQLRERGLHINMSVNLSASLLDHSDLVGTIRSEEHTSELQSLMRNSYAVFCLKKKKYPLLTANKTTNTKT